MLFQYWNDKCVVYHPASGDTHVLTKFHANLLSLLITNATKEEILQLVTCDSEIGSETNADQFIESVTDTYRQLGLLD